MEPEGTEQTAEWIKRNQRLKDARAVWDTTWQEIAEVCFPRKAGITQKDYTPNNGRDSSLYDTKAKTKLERAVAGYMSWTTSKQTPWAEYTPILSQRNDYAVQRWLRECSDLGSEYIAGSNFYTERHEALTEKWGFGTDCLFSQVTPERKTRFEKIRIGSYVFETDADGKPNCVMRELELTAKQAETKFGKENLPRCITEALEKEGDKKFDFLHIVEARKESDRDNSSGFAVAKRKAFLSAYVELQSKKLVQEGGFDTFPFHIGRFLKWDAVNNGADVWGYGPGFTLLPDGRQMNFMAKMIDVYAEKSVFPPMMVPEGFDGALKTAPRATNYYPQSMNPDSVFPLQVTGDWTVAMNRMEERAKQMDQACYLDLFQMFSMNAQAGREMTAYEAGLINSEKLDAISPAFDRDATEVIEPMMIRLFGLWAENGMLPPPPEEAVIVENGWYRVSDPVVTQTGRLALALQMITMRADDNLVQTAAALAAVDPSVLDVIDTTKYLQAKAIKSHANPSILRPDDEIAAIRQSRAQAQQAAQAAEMAKMTAGAVKDVGGVQQAKELIGQ